MVPYVALCISFILIAGLRYRIGGDSIGYENSFETFPTLAQLANYKFSSTRFEPGFLVLGSISKTISDDFMVFQLIHATIVNGVIFWFVAKNTQNKFIAITIYAIYQYFNLNTEVLREALAVSCFLLAWPAFRDGKWFIYYAIMLLGTTFHISAFITFLLPLFTLPGISKGFRLGVQTIFICIAVFIVFYFVQRKFFGFIQSLDAGDALQSRADLYAKSSYGGMNLNIFGILETSLKTIFLPAAALYCLKQRYKDSLNPADRSWIDRIEILIVTGIYFAVITIPIFIAGRFNNYVSLFNFVAIASCFFATIRLKKKSIRLSGLYWSFILFCVLGIGYKGLFAPTFKSTTNKRYMLYYPYSSRLNPQNDPNREEILRVAAHIK